VEEDRARAEQEAAEAELVKVEEAYALVAKDLAAQNEAIALMKKLQDTRTQAGAEQQRLSEQVSKEQQKAIAQTKLTQAELAKKNAETMDAATHAKEELAAATALITKAAAELKASDYGAAIASAELAIVKADQARVISKPQWEASESQKTSSVKAEALARDAAGLPGVVIRREKVGETQRLVVPLRSLFKAKATVLAPGTDPIIDAVAELLKKHTTYPTLIIGHSDARGKRDRLLAMSLARAQSVYGALVSRGVDPKRLSVTANGPDNPIADNKTNSGRSQNNRVEVVFLYQ
jgi:outer membrane protein OmpA-like peptidoglycan-associated protein